MCTLDGLSAEHKFRVWSPYLVVCHLTFLFSLFNMGSMMDELVHCMAAPSHSFLCDLAASSGESDAASLGWQELRGQLKSGQLYGNEL